MAVIEWSFTICNHMIRSFRTPDLGSYGTVDDFEHGFGGQWWRVGYTIPRERAWQAYCDDLQYVLNDVSLLLSNLDAERVVISTDHGHATGEFGI